MRKWTDQTHYSYAIDKVMTSCGQIITRKVVLYVSRQREREKEADDGPSVVGWVSTVLLYSREDSILLRSRRGSARGKQRVRID